VLAARANVIAVQELDPESVLHNGGQIFFVDWDHLRISAFLLLQRVVEPHHQYIHHET
jgi:hypothetical protein